MMWTALAMMFGCAKGGPEAYAGCVVTVVTVQPFGDSVQEETLRYDAEGRLFEARLTAMNSLYPDGVEAFGEYEYEGTCVVRERGRHESPHSWGVGEERRECDEHGHVEQTVTETTWEYEGELHQSTSASVYENGHDGRGRLVSVTSASDYVTEYVWDGLCEEASETLLLLGGELFLREARICNVAGQGVEGEFESFAEPGERFEFYRWRRKYDVAGRILAEERDEGPGTDIFARITYTYDDPTAPGPTEVTTEYEGDVTQIVTYTYDCEG